MSGDPTCTAFVLRTSDKRDDNDAKIRAARVTEFIPTRFMPSKPDKSKVQTKYNVRIAVLYQIEYVSSLAEAGTNGSSKDIAKGVRLILSPYESVAK